MSLVQWLMTLLIIPGFSLVGLLIGLCEARNSGDWRKEALSGLGGGCGLGVLIWILATILYLTTP